MLALLLGAPHSAHAADAAVAPATTEDLDAFDKVLDKQNRGAPAKSNGIGAEISKEARNLKGQVSKQALDLTASRRKGQGHASDAGAGAPDSGSMVSSISGKRSGQQDNPGKGDSGKPVEGNNPGHGSSGGHGH